MKTGMNKSRWMTSALAGLMTVACAATAHAQAVNPLAQPANPLAQPVPEPTNPLAANPLGQGNVAAFPAWLRPGVRLTYRSGSVTVPNNQPVQPDGTGHWKTAGGDRLLPSGARSGGFALSIHTVGDVRPNSIAGDTRTAFPADAAGKLFTYGPVTPLNGDGERMADVWVHPNTLANLKSDQAAGVVISRGTLNREGKVLNTVVREETNNFMQARTVFDAETGLVLLNSFSKVGVAEHRPNNVQNWQPTHNAIMYATVELVSVRQLDLPWVNDGVAEWADGRTLNYQGVQTMIVSVGQPVEMGMTFSARFGQRSGNVVTQTRTTALHSPFGGPPLETTTKVNSMACENLPVWMSPKTAATLRVGQVIDTEPATGYRTAVTAADAQFVTITETNGVTTRIAVYDLRTGVVAAVQMEENNGTAITRTQLRLAQ